MSIFITSILLYFSFPHGLLLHLVLIDHIVTSFFGGIFKIYFFNLSADLAQRRIPEGIANVIQAQHLSKTFKRVLVMLGILVMMNSALFQVLLTISSMITSSCFLQIGLLVICHCHAKRKSGKVKYLETWSNRGEESVIYLTCLQTAAEHRKT